MIEGKENRLGSGDTLQLTLPYNTCDIWGGWMPSSPSQKTLRFYSRAKEFTKEIFFSNPHLHLRPLLLFSLCVPSPLAPGFPFANLEGPSSDLLVRGAC